MRQIILDTETTGLSPAEGHRIIEIGCVELIDRKLTGNHFHRYINPLRKVDPGAFAVHGISDEFLSNKPVFSALVQEFMDFISGAELIIHNAPFDIGFINHELMSLRQGWKQVTDYCGVIDTLQIARKRHAGQKNSLDALCKRYFVDNTKRDLHGALLDSNLLAQVYLAMTGGQGSFFDASTDSAKEAKANETAEQIAASLEKHHLHVVKADENELLEHQTYLDMLAKKGKCLWN
jgi:DNA polymerase-3 subunit epsilon